MRYFKWIQAAVIAALVFFAVPQSTASDTSSLAKATQYATSVSNFPIQSFITADTYLGGSFQVGWFDDAWDVVSSGVSDAWDTVSSAIVDAANAASAALETAWEATSSALTTAASVTGDALKTAGLATANYIKNNPEMMGMIAGAIVLTVVTGGTASPALAAMLGGGSFVTTLVSAGTIAASTYGFYQAQKTAKDIVFAIKDGEYLNAGILSAQLVGNLAGVGGLANMADNMDAAQGLYNAVSEGDFAAIAQNTLKLGSGLTGSNLYNNAMVSAKIINAVNDGEYANAAMYLTELQADHIGVSAALSTAQFGLQAKEAIENLQAAAKEAEDDPSPENQAALALAKEEVRQQVLIAQFGQQLNTAMQNAQAAAAAAHTNSTPASRAALALAESQLQATAQAQATKAQLEEQLNTALQNLQAAATAEQADPSAANKAALLAAQNDATAKAQAVQTNSTTQLNSIVQNLPQGTPTENIVQGTAMIQSAAAQGTLSLTAQTNLSQWLVANPSSQSLTFLAAALDFNTYYTQMSQATPGSAEAAAASTAYNNYISKLTPQVIGALMGFVADNKMNPDTTLLSNQSLFLLDPYQFYLAEEADAEKSNIETLQQSGVTRTSEVTVNIANNYAASQMAQLAANLTPAQRRDLLNRFYGAALSLNDPTAVQTFNQYLSTSGTIITPAPPTTQTLDAQSAVNTTNASVTVIQTQLAAVQQALTGYDYSHYSDANDASLLQVEGSIPPVNGVSANNIQTQIAMSSLSETAKQNLSDWVSANTADPNDVNTAAATLQYAQLLNAAYGTGSAPTAAALQAFASYYNTLPSAAAVAMTNLAEQQGLVTQQTGLIITNPAAYLANLCSPTAMSAHDASLNTALNNIAYDRYLLATGQVSTTQYYQADVSALNAIQPPYALNGNTSYGMSIIYNYTKGWSQAQLQSLASRLYYGSLQSGNGLASLVQTYLTPAGTFQNNPQTIQAQIIGAAAQSTLNSMQAYQDPNASPNQIVYGITPSVLAQYLSSLPASQLNSMAGRALGGGPITGDNQALILYNASYLSALGSNPQTNAQTNGYSTYGVAQQNDPYNIGVPLNVTPTLPNSVISPPATMPAPVVASPPAPATTTASQSITTLSIPPASMQTQPAANDAQMESGQQNSSNAIPLNGTG